MPYFSESSGSYKEIVNNKEIADLGWKAQTDGKNILLKIRDGDKITSIEDSLKKMLNKSSNTRKRKRKHKKKKATKKRG
jgi:hypothetical protein